MGWRGISYQCRYDYSQQVQIHGTWLQGILSVTETSQEMQLGEVFGKRRDYPAIKEFPTLVLFGIRPSFKPHSAWAGSSEWLQPHKAEFWLGPVTAEASSGLLCMR